MSSTTKYKCPMCGEFTVILNTWINQTYMGDEHDGETLVLCNCPVSDDELQEIVDRSPIYCKNCKEELTENDWGTVYCNDCDGIDRHTGQKWR